MTDLVIPQGRTWRQAIPITTPGFDPTGWTLRAQVRAHVSAAAVLHEWSTVAGTASFQTIAADVLTAAGYPTDVPVLCVVLDVAPATSSAWPWRKGVYDVEATGPGPVVLGVDGGLVTVTPEVTR